MSKLIVLTKQKFGRLRVLKWTGKDKWGKSLWLCRCDCGKEKIILGRHLKSGDTQSCGCLQKEKVTKHGHNKRGKITRTYRSWQSMKDRCTNPNNENYKNYGGRRITVCKRWMKFENFLEDMGKSWKPGLTIEREDNDGNYCLENCRWATNAEQNKNKRNNRYETYAGKNRLFVELCREHNMPRKIVYNRFYNYGWTLKEALTTPIRGRRK